MANSRPSKKSAKADNTKKTDRTNTPNTQLKKWSPLARRSTSVFIFILGVATRQSVVGAERRNLEVEKRTEQND